MKIDQPEKYWDRLFAPSSCLALVTTIDALGRPNAASFGTCVRVNHNPVYIAFTCRPTKDTATNLGQVDEFVVNLPKFENDMLEKVRVVGLPFKPGISEIEKAGLTSIPAVSVRPPRITECPRHFECRVEWKHEWCDRLMVVGKVVAASVDDDCIDSEGYVKWERVKSAHFCGAPYHNMFVAAYQTMSAEMPYDGPEVEEYDDFERQIYQSH